VVVLVVVAQAVYILRTGEILRNADAQGTEPVPEAGPPPDGPAPTAPAPVGTLVVRSDPPGAKVEVDGRAAGVTPLSLADVAAGPHQVRLAAAGGRAVNQSITVAAGETAMIVVPLVSPDTSGAAAPPSPPAPARRAASPPAPKQGAVAIASPLDMEIRIGNRVIGRTGGEPAALPPGRHTIQLSDSRSGYTETRTVTVTAGGVARLKVTPPQRPVHINALPWARVTVDGKPVGETPLGNLPMTVGSHVIVFRNPDFPERRETVVVKTDGTTRISVDLRKR
jgi:serine/threonine-protein kinase